MSTADLFSNLAQHGYVISYLKVTPAFLKENRVISFFCLALKPNPSERSFKKVQTKPQNSPL